MRKKIPQWLIVRDYYKMRTKEEINRVIEILLGISEPTRRILKELTEDSYKLGFEDGRHNKRIMEDSQKS